MNKPHQHRFHWRGFMATTTGLAFLGLYVTGIIMFILPPGRIANWTGWTLGGLTKHQWSSLHLWMGVVFIVTAVVHLYFNWRVFLSYFKHKVSKHFALRAEWITSLVLCGIVTLGVITGVRPFSLLTEWKEDIRYSWDTTEYKARAVQADPLPLHESTGRGAGIGRMTLSQYCDEFGLDLNEAITALNQAEVKADRRMTLREIADAAGLHPSEVRQLLVP
jgi:hypothetical protein